MAGYGSNEGFKSYALDAGYVIPSNATAAALTSARQRGSMAVDRYEPRLSGMRTGGFGQERAFPRSGATTYWGETIPTDEIPSAVVNASYEAAVLEFENPGILSPVVTGSSVIKREKIATLETEYATSSATDVRDVVALATPVVTAIEGLLWPFFMPVMPGILVV